MLWLDLLRRLILRVAELELVGHRRRGGEEVEVIFARQPLLNDLEVEQAQKAAAEAEAQCRRAFHLEREARIVQPQLLDALAQFLEIIRVGREHAAEDDGLDFLEPRQRRRGGLFRVDRKSTRLNSSP